MNNNHNGDHPSEEQLLEFALNGAPLDIGRHVNGCPVCAETVKDFREVKDRVASFEEKEVPDTVERRILRITRHGRRDGPLPGLQSLFVNPFFIALIIAIMVIVLYFLVGSEVFKAP